MISRDEYRFTVCSRLCASRPLTEQECKDLYDRYTDRYEDTWSRTTLLEFLLGECECSRFGMCLNISTVFWYSEDRISSPLPPDFRDVTHHRFMCYV